MWQPVSPEAKWQVHVPGLDIKVVMGMGWFSPLLVLTSAACFVCQPARLQQMKRWVKVSVFPEMKQNHHGINERPWCAWHCESMHKLPPSSAIKLQVCLAIFHVSDLIMPVWKQPCTEVLWREESSWFSGEFQGSQLLWGQNEKKWDVAEAVLCIWSHRDGWGTSEKLLVLQTCSISSLLCLVLREEGGNNFAVKVFW